jgi:hypothetical protein
MQQIELGPVVRCRRFGAIPKRTARAANDVTVVGPHAVNRFSKI